MTKAIVKPYKSHPLKPAVCRALMRRGLRKTEENTYEGLLTDGQYKRLQSYCQGKHLSCKINNDFGKRDTKYRQKFFEANPPHFCGRYFCAYCGALLEKDDITVDHLYPVAKVSKNVKLQKKLKRMGMRNVNDVKNLVASCPVCNQRKLDHMGWWIVKGRRGRNPMYWGIRWTFRILLLLFVSITCFLYFTGGVDYVLAVGNMVQEALIDAARMAAELFVTTVPLVRSFFSNFLALLQQHLEDWINFF